VIQRHFSLLACVMLIVCSLGARSTAVQAGGGGTNGLEGINLLVQTNSPQIDLAQRRALAVLGADYNGVTHAAAANYYSNPWIRDSFAWGMVPSIRDASIGSYSSAELAYWLDRQQTFGGWLTARKSGYFDETPILISAVLDSYKVSGDIGLVKSALPKLERGWSWLQRGFIKPQHGSTVLIYANVPPHVSTDWADQIGRTGYATQLEALWYWATKSLGIMERLTGHLARSQYYSSFASRIRSDINRLLWTTAAPYVRNAPAVPAFGHYRSWVGPRDYFELDSNFVCILYGIADREQARSIVRFVEAHDDYLLGVGTVAGVPARVLYGDYAPADYAGKHERLGPDQYQSAYWPTVGALVAIGLASTGETAESRAVIQQLSNAVVRSDDVREWYTRTGDPKGAPSFGWGARMFILALYAAYLGISSYADVAGSHVDTGISVRLPAGQGSAEIAYRGRDIHAMVTGQGGQLRLIVAGKVREGVTVPGILLCAGCNLQAIWG
jgi:hypothetical protein